MKWNIYNEGKWFAWYPVRVGNKRVWLEYVMRIKTLADAYYGGWTYNEVK